ncbi:very short patch repair endonuclease [Patescibacteria group bacterium]
MDVLTKKQRSYCMSQIKSSGTVIEKYFRQYLKKKGLRGYLNNAKITGRPDLYFPREKIAIFIDGCFWHKCPKCYKKPRSNVKFWNKKIKDNKRRDKNVNKILKKKGIRVLRFWEHRVKNNPGYCYKKIKVFYGKK